MTERLSERAREHLSKVWSPPPGLGQLSAVNHTAVGNRFIVTGLAFFVLGGLLAMLMRIQIALPGHDFIDHRTYNQLFTMHGTTMMFLFAVPVLEGFALYLIPKLIGARDLIFPRLSAFGYWCYLFGGIVLYSSFLFGEVPDTGWFMYTPLSGSAYSPGSGPDFWLLGITFVEISAVTASAELIVSILKTRTPGMSLMRMPLFVWAMLVASFMILFGFPPLILASILLEIERAFGWPFYQPEFGGDPLLWQHLFWLFGHPEVYIIFLPATGMLSMMIPTLAGRPIVAYSWIVMSLIATGFISFGLWVHHMFATGIPHLALTFFSAASMTVVIPTAIQIFAWIATLWQGRPRINVPMLFVIGFFINFIIGGLTGIMVALVPFNWQVHDTHFIVAHLHYVLIGGMVFPLFAALYYWLPHFTGRMYTEAIGRTVFWLFMIGFNLTFFIMHLTGLLGMPRRVYTYADGLGWAPLNLLSSVGGFLMSAAVGLLLVDLLLHARYGRRAPANPWRASSLEWAMPTPSPPYNFASQMPVTARDPLWAEPDLRSRDERGEGYLPGAPSGRRETLATGVLHADPEAVIHLPSSTYLPLITAAATLVFFVSFLAKWYGLAVAGALLTIALFFLWAWRSGHRDGSSDVAVGHEQRRLPLHHYTDYGPGWWGTAMGLAANGSLYVSLLFAYFFLWTVVDAWPPSGALIDPGWEAPAALVAVLLGTGAVYLGLSALTRGAGTVFALLIGLAAALGIVAVVLQGIEWLRIPIPPTAHAYGALVHTISAYMVGHVVLSILMAGFVLVRLRYGFIAPGRRLAARVFALFWYYSGAAWVLGFAVLYGSTVLL